MEEATKQKKSHQQPLAQEWRPVSFVHSLPVRLFVIFYAALLMPVFLLLYSIDVPVPLSSIILVVVTAFLISCTFAYMVARPILMLVERARRITMGETLPDLQTTRKDEIGKLFNFFNATAKQFTEGRERSLAVSQIKSQFVTVAAHQLRTPLSALKWSLRLMLDGDMGEINERQREFLQQSYQTNEHIIRLINDFLDISHIEEGRFGFQFQKIRILDTIQKAVEASLAQAVIRDVRVSFIKEAPADLEIIADESRMFTAVINILDNAVRYSNAGSEVIVRAAIVKNMLEVQVTDNGVGIPAAEQSKIFSRFYRASNALRQQTEGSGLGLFIAKNIIERHGGTIGFTSEEQKGTTIFFVLPSKEDFIKKQETSYQSPSGAA